MPKEIIQVRRDAAPKMIENFRLPGDMFPQVRPGIREAGGDEFQNEAATALLEIKKAVHADGSKPTEKLAYPRREAAFLLSMSLSTLDRLTERGLIRPSRATGRPLYSRREMERFLAETTVETD